MFCDLVGSTALSEQLDPEDLREVMLTYREVCAKVINRFEGYIAQFLGDGLLVYFGYPVAHEDDAHRAVRTGLGIIEAIKNLNSQLEQERGVKLAVRLGIHTGLVVAGDMITGNQLQPKAVVGETPNKRVRTCGDRFYCHHQAIIASTGFECGRDAYSRD
jgi:class 3 adenylate cyclase